MKLKKLEITNFRCFESLSIDLDEQLIVLVAKNGQGKSSVLDAIRIGLWPFVSGFDLAHTGYSDPANGISVDDVRMLKMRDGQMARQLPCKITLTTNYQIEPIVNSRSHEAMTLTWTRSRESEAPRTKTKDDESCKPIKAFANVTQEYIRNPESPDTDLPVIGYYGTGTALEPKIFN